MGKLTGFIIGAFLLVGAVEAQTIQNPKYPFDPCYENRGDLNHSGGELPLDISDICFAVEYLAFGTPIPFCDEEADVNADGSFDINDIVYMVGYCFEGEPNPPPIRDYALFFHSPTVTHTKRFFTYKTYSGQLDSFYLPYRVDGPMDLAADGRTLYLPSYYPDTGAVVTDWFTLVISIPDGTVLDSIPHAGCEGVKLSPDGSMLALMCDTLFFVSTADYSVLHYDTGWYAGGVFSPDNKTFYCMKTHGATADIYTYDIENSFQQSTIQIDPGWVGQIIPTPDNSKLILRLSYGFPQSEFAIYDIASDSVIFRDFLYYGIGWNAMTPDGTLAFYSYGGSFDFPSDLTEFAVFDIESNERIATIQAEVQYENGNSVFFVTGPMAVSPDSRWMLMTSQDGRDGFILFDVREMRVRRYHSLEGTLLQVRYLLFQNGL